MKLIVNIFIVTSLLALSACSSGSSGGGSSASSAEIDPAYIGTWRQTNFCIGDPNAFSTEDCIDETQMTYEISRDELKVTNTAGCSYTDDIVVTGDNPWTVVATTKSMTDPGCFGGAIGDEVTGTWEVDEALGQMKEVPFGGTWLLFGKV